MKTSNKLLIAFASALILIPALGMIYTSQVKFKVGTQADMVEHKIEDFSTATKYMTSIPLATSFESINFADAKEVSFGIRFIKDEKSGIKIPERYKDLINASVDANGQLQLSIKNAPQKENDRNYVDIYVYGPNLKEVSVSNAEATYITATLDSLKFNVNKSGDVGVGSGAHISHLNITTNNVSAVRLREDDVKSLTLNLNNTNFSTESISYDNLSIATLGNCGVKIMGDYDNDQQYSIKNLVLNTVGKAAIKMEKINVINCAGTLSDETIVQMPAINLNQMFKK